VIERVDGEAFVAAGVVLVFGDFGRLRADRVLQPAQAVEGAGQGLP
jgi:hypothetical protein